MKNTKRLIRSFFMIISSFIMLFSPLTARATDYDFYSGNDVIFYDPNACSLDGSSSATSTTEGSGIYSVDNKNPGKTGMFHPGDHKGFHTDARDPYTYPGGDSINGIKEAIKKGYSQIDQDTRMTKDGVPILIHNATPASEDFTGPGSNKDVADLTLAQVKQLTNHGVHIATLEEVLSYVKEQGSDIRVQVEWKPNRVITETEIATIANLFNKYGVKGAFKGGAVHKAIADSLSVAQKHGFWVRSTFNDGNGWVGEVWHAPTVTAEPGTGTVSGDLTPIGPVKVAQANIKTSVSADSFKNQLNEVIATNPDFVSGNEWTTTNNAIKRPGYDFYRDTDQSLSNATAGESSALTIMWKSDRWTKVDAGIKRITFDSDVDYQLSTVTGVPHDGKRVMIWVTLQNSNGGKVSFISTHLPVNPNKYSPTDKRKILYQKGAERIAEKIKELQGAGPVILAGDLNAQINDDGPWHPRQVFGNAGMEATADSLPKSGPKNVAVDWIFYSKQDIKPISQSSPVNLADHPLLLATLDITSNGLNTSTGACACPTSGSGSDVPIEGNDNEEKAWNFLTGKGLSAEQAAGIMGNISVESSFDPQAGKGKSHIGISQWDSGGRWPALVTWAQGQNLSEWDFDTQLKYTWKEATDRGNISGIKKYDDVKKAAWYWGRYFEVAITTGSSDTPLSPLQGLDSRLSRAQDYLGKYSGVVGASSNSSVSGSSCSDQSSSGDASNFSVDGMTIYNQVDPRWKDHPYGTTGKTVGTSGCGPTAMATIITALTGKSVTPIDTSDYATQKGMYVPGVGSSHQISPILAAHWGLKAKNIQAKIATINAELRKGGMVITSGTGAAPFTSSGHIIAIRGVTSDGKWKIADSNGTIGQSNSKKDWDPNVILGTANADNFWVIYK